MANQPNPKPEGAVRPGAPFGPSKKPYGPDALAELAATLEHIEINSDTPYEAWLGIGRTIHRIDSSEAGLAVWEKWSKSGSDPRTIGCDYASYWHSFAVEKWAKQPASLEHELDHASEATKAALVSILAERREQQTVHGRSLAQDLYYNRDDQLSLAACAFIHPPHHGRQRVVFWPWRTTSFKPGDHDRTDRLCPLYNRQTDLKKGIAMALADLERVTILLNEKPQQAPTHEPIK